MKEIERQYRASMRWYSARWRRVHGEALLQTLLEGAEVEDRSRPTRSEQRNLAATGLRQRFSAVIPYVFFTVAFIAGCALLTAWRAGFQSTLVVTVPGLGYPILSSLWLGAAGAGLFVISGGFGGLLLRRNHRALTLGVISDD